MYQIFIGSVILSLIHALIPNHWIPLIAISKTEKWTKGQTIWATVITGFSHTFSTIIIGIAVGLVGYKLSSRYESVSNLAAPIILIGLGLVYLILDFIRGHHHSHDNQTLSQPTIAGKSRWWAIIISLSFAMFLTPCIEIEAYYFQAGTIGWIGIFIVSAVYLLVTLGIMLLLVSLGLKGVQTFNLKFIEHHEKGITGTVLIFLGLLAIFVKF